MNKENLMIGDWVCKPGGAIKDWKFIKIESGKDIDELADKVAPILMSPTILSKFGYNREIEMIPKTVCFMPKMDSPMPKTEATIYNNRNGITLILNSDYTFDVMKDGFHLNITISCVHELQHVMRLLKINDDIEL